MLSPVLAGEQKVEQIVLNSVKRILGQAGFDVDATLSGRQGLEWALNRTYDVILTDIRMPDIGGMIVLLLAVEWFLRKRWALL